MGIYGYFLIYLADRLSNLQFKLSLRGDRDGAAISEGGQIDRCFFQPV